MKSSNTGLCLLLASTSTVALAWVSNPSISGFRTRSTTTALDAAVGIFYGTSTGSTQTVAEKIYEAFGSDVAAEPVDVDTLKGAVAAAFAEHDALVVGTPTWNTGADSERSGTGWDELYYKKLPEIKDALAGKKVAVFGLGDQVSYAENYADATGELFDVFQGLGCQMLGSWSQEGYEHEASKSIRGDKFCGLLLDMVNQEDLTDDRVQRWVAQLKEEGILDSSGRAAAPAAAAPAASVAPAAPSIAPPVATTAPAMPAGNDRAALLAYAAERLAQIERENQELRRILAENSDLMDQAIGSQSADGFTPHRNPVSGETMWTSPDGRQYYITTAEQTKTKSRAGP